jgi:hypothetical protein
MPERSETRYWTVMRHALGTWRVVAATHVVYQAVYNSSGLGTNIKNLNTTSQFEGSQLLISSTWTPTLTTDDILNNNTPTAKTKSTVAGTVRHVYKPFSNNPACVLTEKVDFGSNYCEMEF